MHRRSVLAGTLIALALPLRALKAAFVSNRISVEVRGSGPDVILIPGLTSGREVWSALVAALPGYRFHLLQVAGFAGEAAGANARGPVLEPLAEEVARYILANRLPAPAIIGHSMGGTIGMMVAARRPALIGRLMVVDMLPSPAGLIGATAAEIRPFADTLLDALTSSPGGQALLRSMVGGGTPGRADSDPDVVAHVTHELAVTDLTSDLGRIRAPFTILYATTPGEDAARVARTYQAAYRAAPAAHLIRVADSGHMIMQDQPQRFAAAVRDFLR